MRISDETLMAYVDGELDAAARTDVERAARTDAALARRIQAQRRLRAQIAGVFAGVASEPPPDRLVEAVRKARQPATVVDLAQARAKRTETPIKPKRASWIAWASLAACAVLALGIGYRLTLPMSAGQAGGLAAKGPSVGGTAGALMAQNGLSDALSTQLAADNGSRGGLVRIGLSFRATDGRYCRTFQVQQGDGFAGLACREPQGWRIRMAIATPSLPGDSPAYRTAASETPAPILDAVGGMIAGSPFNAQQEAAGRAGDWKN